MFFRPALILFFVLEIHSISIAQKFPRDRNFVEDTLSTNEMSELNAAARNTTFGYFHLADSCSNNNDSVNASAFFMKVDPYYFLKPQLQLPPASFDSAILDSFNLTRNAKKKYLAIYTAMYNSPKSVAYKKFSEMAIEDQAVRHRQEKCRDSTCYSLTGMEMRHTDSLHFDYLYKYIKKNGWPSLSNGAIYASLLAIHDHPHHGEYIPILKEAIRQGKADIETLRLIVFWKAREKEFKDLQKYIHCGNFLKYNVDEMLDNKTPKLLNEIKYNVSAHCPVNLILICECRDIKRCNNWFDKVCALNIDDNILATFMIRLANYNCKIDANKLRAMQEGCWTVHWQPADHEELRLFLYLTYKNVPKK